MACSALWKRFRHTLFLMIRAVALSSLPSLFLDAGGDVRKRWRDGHGRAVLKQAGRMGLRPPSVRQTTFKRATLCPMSLGELKKQSYHDVLQTAYSSGLGPICRRRKGTGIGGTLSVWIPL